MSSSRDKPLARYTAGNGDGKRSSGRSRSRKRPKKVFFEDGEQVSSFRSAARRKAAAMSKSSPVLRGVDGGLDFPKMRKPSKPDLSTLVERTEASNSSLPPSGAMVENKSRTEPYDPITPARSVIEARLPGSNTTSRSAGGSVASRGSVASPESVSMQLLPKLEEQKRTPASASAAGVAGSPGLGDSRSLSRSTSPEDARKRDIQDGKSSPVNGKQRGDSSDAKSPATATNAVIPKPDAKAGDGNDDDNADVSGRYKRYPDEDYVRARRPHVFPPFDPSAEPGATPKTLIFSCLVNNILEVNLIDGYFKPDLSFLLDWTDDGELTPAHALKRASSDIWKPYLQFGNQVDEVQKIEENTDVYKLRGRPVICHYRRCIPTLSQTMPLADFPFDTLELEAEMQFGWTTSDLRVVPGELEVDAKIRQMDEYVFVDGSIDVRDRYYDYFTCYDDSHKPYPEVAVRLTMARNPWYYIQRLVIPQLLLSLMALTSFFLDPEELNDRFSVSGTIILSEVALYFVAVQMLPRVPYEMRIDLYFTYCLLLVFGIWFQNLYVYRYRHRYTDESLEAVDLWSAVGYVTGVVLCTVWFMIPYVRFKCKYSPMQRVAGRVADKNANLGKRRAPGLGSGVQMSSTLVLDGLPDRPTGGPAKTGDAKVGGPTERRADDEKKRRVKQI